MRWLACDFRRFANGHAVRVGPLTVCSLVHPRTTLRERWVEWFWFGKLVWRARVEAF